MALTRLAITRPLAILMLIVSLILMGAVSFTRMKVDRFPNISFPAVFVSVAYTGAAPTDMEELVTKPVENALSGLPGIDTISSTSAEGISRINVRFIEGTDTNQAALDVDRKISSVRRRLPTDIDAPSITKADISSIPVMNIALSSSKNRTLSELYDIGNDTVLPRLQSVDGVADVQLIGGLQNQAALDVDRKISSVRRRLPTDIDAPSITKADISSIPVMNIALSSSKNRTLSELYDIGNDTVLPRLQSVDGVADVQLIGGL